MSTIYEFSLVLDVSRQTGVVFLGSTREITVLLRKKWTSIQHISVDAVISELSLLKLEVLY